MKKNILIVVAHPDDEIIGCGGFISRFKKQSNFKVLIIAEGSSCRFKNIFKEKKEIQKKVELRKRQAKKALALFSIKDVTFCDLPCGSLNSIPSVKINHLIEKQIKIFKPEKILTHSSEDLHPDHRAVFHSVMQATRPIKDNTVKEILSFEILSSSVISISLNDDNKFADDKYFQIIFEVFSLGSNSNLGFVLWARWKSNIDFSDIELSIFEV